MQIEYWLPVPIMCHNVSDQLRENTKKVIDGEFVKQNVSYISEENLSTSFFDHENILDNQNLVGLKQTILNVAREFAISLGFSSQIDLSIFSSWLNLFKKGNGELLHAHYGHFISGVYYVNVDANSSSFYFPDHVDTRLMWQRHYKKYLVKNIDSIEYTPTEGKLLLFPSWLIHGVKTNVKETDRISLAFNIDIQS